MGFALRSVSTRAARPASPPTDDPRTVSSASNSRRVSGGPARRTAVSGSSSARASRSSSACLGRNPPEAPLGFTLPRYTSKSLGRDFAQPPPTRLTARAEASAAAPRSIVQLSPGRDHRSASADRATATFTGFLRRTVPNHSCGIAPGLWVHLPPRRASLPSDRRSLNAAPHCRS